MRVSDTDARPHFDRVGRHKYSSLSSLTMDIDTDSRPCTVATNAMSAHTRGNHHWALLRQARQPRRGLIRFAQRININWQSVSERRGKDGAGHSAFVRRGNHCGGNRIPDPFPTLQRVHVNIVAQILKSKPDQSVYTTTPTAWRSS